MNSTKIPTNLQPNILSEKSYLDAYIKTFDEKELKAYNIAVDHLGMSFQLEKSIGYIAWKKKQVST